MPAARAERIKVYAAIGLALVLVGTGYARFFHKSTAAPEADQVTAAPAHNQASVPQVKLPSIYEKTGRHKTPGKESLPMVPRDIFARVRLPARAEPQAVTVREEVSEPLPSLVLKGVVVGGGSSLAIINDQFVRKGEPIGAYKVLRIGKKEVVLGSDKNTVVLQLEKNE